MNRKDLTQHGFSVILSLLTALVSMSLMVLFIYDYFSNNYPSTFPTTYLMVATAFTSFVTLLLTFSIVKKDSYVKAKPTFHRVFIAITIVLVVSTIVGGTSPLNNPTYSWIAFGIVLILFFVHAGSYSLIIQIDRSTGEIDKYFKRGKIIHKKRKK